MSQFKQIMSALSVAFQKELTPELVKLYYNYLSKYPEPLVLQAVNKIILQDKYFPKISRIIEMIEGDMATRGINAWVTVLEAIRDIGPYESIQFEDPYINQTISELGGWPEICNKTKKELEYLKNDFLNIYDMNLKIGKKENKHLTGITERESHLNGIEYNEKPVLYSCKYIKVPEKKLKQIQNNSKKHLKGEIKKN